MDDHLGYTKHEQSDHSNNRNGHSSKRLKTSEDGLVLDTPRDRDGSFESTIVKKHQTRYQVSTILGLAILCYYQQVNRH